MRLNEIEDLNQSQKDVDGIIFGQMVPDWSVDDDEVAIFSSNSNFAQAQVFKTKSGKFFVDFGKGNTCEYRYAGQVESNLKKLKLTLFDRIDYYRPSAY